MAILPLTRKGFTTVLKQLAKKAIAACGFELHRQRNPVPAPAWSQLLNNAEGVLLKRTSNPLEQFFNSHTEGPGIWKWRHYFEIYHKHFSKFVGKEVHVLEIGVYSGGSLAMWKHYFGPQSKIYGVDIEPACKAYEERGSISLARPRASASTASRPATCPRSSPRQPSTRCSTATVPASLTSVFASPPSATPMAARPSRAAPDLPGRPFAPDDGRPVYS